MTLSALTSSANLRDAVRVIEETRKTIAVVTDDTGRVIGALTDGDIRRALLAGRELSDCVTEAMNPSPITAEETTAQGYLLECLQANNLEALPLVDADGRFKRVVHINDLSPEERTGGAEGFFAAVIMAGGEGLRLRPLTDTTPKVMLDVGGMPLIERQVRRLAKSGIKRIYISVGYLREVIENHLGDGADFAVSIEYLHEKKKLGTGGALSLLPTQPTGPLLVINGDVLTTSDYRHLLDFHLQHDATVTVAAADYHLQIPYGVIKSDGVRAVALEEKPSQRFLCNAGIYALAPDATRLVPHDQFYNMTDLIERCIGEGRHVVVFLIHEYWTDIGTLAELEKAREAMKNDA